MKRLVAGAGAALALTLVWVGTAHAFVVGDGTFASGVGAVGWHLEATVGGHSRKYTLISQELDTTPAFEDHPEHTGDSDQVLRRHGRLAIGAGGQEAPVVEQQLYATTPGSNVETGVNIAGIVTNFGVKRLEIRYAYSAARPPTTPGAGTIIVRNPVQRRRLDHTLLKFWMAGATGGAGGYPFHIDRIRGRVLRCSHGKCRPRWQTLYRG